MNAETSSFTVKIVNTKNVIGTMDIFCPVHCYYESFTGMSPNSQQKLILYNQINAGCSMVSAHLRPTGRSVVLSLATYIKDSRCFVQLFKSFKRSVYSHRRRKSSFKLLHLQVSFHSDQRRQGQHSGEPFSDENELIQHKHTGKTHQ